MREGYKKTDIGIIPEDWEVGSFKDIIKLRKESFNPLIENNEKYIGLEHIEEKTGRLLGIGESEETSSTKNKFYKGDILFGKLRPYLRKYYIADFNGVCVTEILPLVSINSNNKFCFYKIQEDKFIEYINNITFGTKMPRTSWNDIKDYKLAIPPLKEQEKIAEILSTVDSQIDDTEKLIEKSKELKKGLMQKLLTKGIGHSEFKKTEVGEIPFDWEIKTLESIASVIDSLHETPKYIDNGISMIRVVDINGGYIQTTKTVKVSDETYKKFTRKYTPRKGDIIMSRVGSYGLVSYLRDNNKVCLGQNIVVINTDINKKFLFYALSSQYIKNEIDKVTVGSSQKSLSLANIKKLHIVLPTSSEQVNISNILESIDKNIEEYINKLEELKYLKKGLMQQLLTGKIRVNNL